MTKKSLAIFVVFLAVFILFMACGVANAIETTVQWNENAIVQWEDAEVHGILDAGMYPNPAEDDASASNNLAMTTTQTDNAEIKENGTFYQAPIGTYLMNVVNGELNVTSSKAMSRHVLAAVHTGPTENSPQDLWKRNMVATEILWRHQETEMRMWIPDYRSRNIAASGVALIRRSEVLKLPYCDCGTGCLVGEETHFMTVAAADIGRARGSPNNSTKLEESLVHDGSRRTELQALKLPMEMVAANFEMKKTPGRTAPPFWINNTVTFVANFTRPISGALGHADGISSPLVAEKTEGHCSGTFTAINSATAGSIIFS